MRIEDLSTLLGEHPLLRRLRPADLELLAGCARNVAFDTGELILVTGAPADTFYLLRRGRVALEVHDPGRGRLVIETLEPGSALGWSWLFPPYRWHLDARALEPVGAVAIDTACLLAKAEADPALGYELMRSVAPVIIDRLQSARLRLLDLYGEPAGEPALGADELARANST